MVINNSRDSKKLVKTGFYGNGIGHFVICRCNRLVVRSVSLGEKALDHVVMRYDNYLVMESFVVFNYSLDLPCPEP